MSTSEAAEIDEVGDFYDESAWSVEMVGGSIHLGYWLSDDDPTPFLEAINRLSDIVGEKLDLRAGQRLLDVGCGVAAPAIRFAQRTDAEIVGITNSRAHAAEARRRVIAAGLRGQVVIEDGDAAALRFEDESFDAVLALESLVHATDRGVWLREMLRVLRPGGRLVITDTTADVPLSDHDNEVLGDFTLVPPLTTFELVELVRDSGFVVDEFTSCGGRIRRSYTAYYDRVLQRRPELVAAFGAEKIDPFLTEMPKILGILEEKIGCAIVSGHKRA